MSQRSLAGPKRPHRRRPRQGAVLIAVIVCTILVSVVTAGMLQTVLRRRLELRRAQWRQQASWLVQSGLERAVAQLDRDPQFRGETWRPVGDSGGVVRITLQDQNDGLLIEVQADYPDDPLQRARQTQQLQLAAPVLSKQPDSGDAS